MESEIQDSQNNASNEAEQPVEPSAAGTAGQPTTPPGETPSFGWNAYAERINGRFAMIGFVALLLLQFFTRQDFFTWLGL
jgi:hypothetical protein